MSSFIRLVPDCAESRACRLFDISTSSLSFAKPSRFILLPSTLILPLPIPLHLFPHSSPIAVPLPRLLYLTLLKYLRKLLSCILIHQLPLSRPKLLPILPLNPRIASSHKMSHSVFPVELMNEIFRSSELDQATLASCCLLSRRYLQAAQRWLYHSIEIRCFQSGINGGEVDSEDGDMWEYSKMSWLLLVTLRGSEFLRSHIRSLEFATGGYDCSHVRTSLNSAALTFITAAPDCQQLVMKNEEPDCGTEWSANEFGGGLEYTTFSAIILDVLPDDFDRFTDSDSLERITLISTESDPLGDWTDSDDTYQLTHFEIFRKSSKLLDFLRTSFKSLRILQVPLSDFPSLPFAELTELAHLTLLYGTDQDRSKKLQLSRPFWTTFGRSPSLRKLTFSGSSTQEEKEALFGGKSDRPVSQSRIPRQVKSTILTCKPPSLQRLEFVGATSFDLISLILDRPEIVVPEIGLSKKSSAFETETLRSMFERSAVELIWVETKAWDVCISLLCLP